MMVIYNILIPGKDMLQHFKSNIYKDKEKPTKDGTLDTHLQLSFVCREIRSDCEWRAGTQDGGRERERERGRGREGGRDG